MEKATVTKFKRWLKTHKAPEGEEWWVDVREMRVDRLMPATDFVYLVANLDEDELGEQFADFISIKVCDDDVNPSSFRPGRHGIPTFRHVHVIKGKDDPRDSWLDNDDCDD